MNTTFPFYTSTAQQDANRVNTPVARICPSHRLLPFQIERSHNTSAVSAINLISCTANSYIDWYLPSQDELQAMRDNLYTREWSAAYIRNVELDDRLSPSEETLITVTAKDTTAGTVTFSTLPDGLSSKISNATAGEEWLCVNVDSFNVGSPPYTRTGNYTLAVLLDGGGDEVNGFGYSLVSGFGDVTSWSVGDQVIFFNPFTYADYGTSNLPDLESSDFPTLSPSYISSCALFKRTDGTWVSIVSLNSPGTYLNAVSYATSTSPHGPWTANDAYLVEPTDIDPTYTSVIACGLYYLAEESKYITLLNCRDPAVSKGHISVMKFDENFNSMTFYDKIIEEPASTGGCSPCTLSYKNGYYHITYNDRKSGDPESEDWELKHTKSTSYGYGYETAKILLTGSTSAGASADDINKYYNAYVDGGGSFTYNSEIYMILAGTSRHDESGTRGNRSLGLAKFNTSTEELEFSRLGIVFPNFLTGAWTDTSWGLDHVGSGVGIYNDNGRYYMSVTMNASTDTYKVIHAEIDIDTLLNTDTGIGNFKNDIYWSSTESDAGNAVAQDFLTDEQKSVSKSLSQQVRPSRTFTGAWGAYSVGDKGPTGGWIYNVATTTYYEAAAADLTAAAWSNVTATAVTGTSTAIGDGETNTSLIIAQTGHETSAALNCDALPGISLMSGYFASVGTTVGTSKVGVKEFTTNDYIIYDGGVLNTELPYGVYYIQLKDSYGTYYSEHFSVRNLQPAQVTDWSGANNYTSFAYSGMSISTAVSSGGFIASGYSSDIIGGVRIGEKINFACNLTLTSGIAPYVTIVDSTNASISNNSILAEGINDIELTLTHSATSAKMKIYDDAGGGHDFELSFSSVRRSYGDYIKVEFSNTDDLRHSKRDQILYATGGFKQRVYFNTRLNVPNSEPVEIGEELDGVFRAEQINATYLYNIVDYVSRSMFRGIQFLPMHDAIIITDEVGNEYTPDVGNVAVTIDWNTFDTGTLRIEFNDGAMDWVNDQSAIT